MRDACVLEDRADHEDDKKNNNDDDKDSTIIYTSECQSVFRFVSFRFPTSSNGNTSAKKSHQLKATITTIHIH